MQKLTDDDTAVRVVVRIRPQISRDVLDLCHVCTRTIPNEPQIWIGNDKTYTFDHVFDMPTVQEEVFDNCVQELVDGCFDGYNATVLAYGQTGSGKTYTMGTGFDHTFQEKEKGIIPRAVEHLFNKIKDIQQTEHEKGCTPPEFKVNAQFMELYNEDVIDLLDTTRDLDNKKKTHIRIHEDADGKIYTQGVIAQCVTNVEEALQCLKIGSLSRTTASTGMNTQSSRSHAIFTLHIKQQRVVKLGKSIAGEETCNSSLHKHNESLNEFETLTAKFHFVDLAGSERLKRTGATGDRQKESISINSGLLALGNVISALGDKSKKVTHVPYRDSKLTRLLQDSLGGNSRTLMIACVSPSDRDFVETLSTLKYANRAKNIRNKVVANKDKSSQTINALLKQVEGLQMELMEFKQGKRLLREDGVECINDMYHENTMLQSENNSLKTRIKALQETIERLTQKNAALLVEKQSGEWIISGTDGVKSDSNMSAVIQGYVAEIETLRAKLIEYEEACAILRKSALKASPQYAFSPTSTVAITGHYDIRIDSAQTVTEILEEAKENVKKLKKKEKKLKVKEKESILASDDEKDVTEEIDNFEDTHVDGDSSSSSDTEKTDQEEKLSESLAEITCDISLKEKLIRQLEISQKRLHNMRQHYEEKIVQLQTKIMETEKERDKIISNLSKTAESKSEEKRIRADYEKKISSLKNDVKNFENAKKHHVQLMSTASSSEAQLKKLKQEVADMKRTKVTLLNKMKEESKKFRDSEQKRNKEIAQLKKEKLNKDSQIKALEAEKRRKEIVLKKRTEEILSLKKRTVKHTSPRIMSRTKPGPNQLKAAKQRWLNLEKKINKLVLNKQNVAAVEKEMDRWLKEREKIGRCLDKLSRKREQAIKGKKPINVIEEFEDEMESLRANIEYIHENLSECQSAITGLEETKENFNPEDIINTLNNMQLEESHYIIEKIVHMAIDQSFQNSQKEVTIKELESQLSQVIESHAVQEQLLFHVVQQTNEHLTGYIQINEMNLEEESDTSGSESRSASPSPNDSIRSVSQESTLIAEKPKQRKARNIAATTEQLLFSCGEPSSFNDDFTITNLSSEPPNVFSMRQMNGYSQDKSKSYVILPALHRGEVENDFDLDFTEKNEVTKISEFKPVIAGNGFQSKYLTSTYVVEGHEKPVLCVECTDDVLFSSSDDGSVRIWDLSTNMELQKLQRSNSVTKVRYCEYTRRAFTASNSEILLWDVRQKPATCRSLFKASEMNQSFTSEYEVSDIALNQYGTLLYGAFSRSVRMWDLRMLQCLGALDVSYGSNAKCLAVTDIEFKKNRVVCGCQDKSIKVYDIREENYGVHQPQFSLTPPHYDSVQALAVHDSFLFSASKDMSIRKWDLERRSLDVTLNQAHDDWICAINLLRDNKCIVSGCRSGILKLWSLDKCKFLEEIIAHRSSINSIASNSASVYTASSDCTIGVWKMKNY